MLKSYEEMIADIEREIQMNAQFIVKDDSNGQKLVKAGEYKDANGKTVKYIYGLCKAGDFRP